MGPTIAALIAATTVRVVVPASPDSAAAPTMDAQCIGCHADEAAQWHGSQHRSAFTDAPFQTALAIEPRGFCVGCHAPQADPGLRTVTAASARGVGCIDCHGSGDAIASGLGEAHANAPHPVRRDPEFGGPQTCGRCHQFEFPDTALRDAPLLMQSTVDEHARSKFADVSCASCHMPKADHTLSVSRDPAWLRRAVDVQVQRVGETQFGDTRIRVTLTAARIGHAFPTGDLFRRLEVGAQVDGHPARRRYLARHFGREIQRSGIAMRGELADNRVPADGTPRVVELTVPGAAAGQEVRWWVRHQRVGHHRSPDARDATLQRDGGGEVTVAEGVLRPPR